MAAGRVRKAGPHRVRFLLDTNACIGYLTGRAPGVLRRVKALPATDIAVCSVMKLELFRGAAKSADPVAARAGPRQFLDQFASLELDDRAAEIGGRVGAELEAKGTPIGPYDLQIAAIALADDLTLVTHNVREFSRVEGLRIEDWESSL